MRNVFQRVVLLTLLGAAGCATAPSDALHTVLLTFARPIQDADIRAAQTIGGTVAHRIDVAQALDVRTALSPSAYSGISGISAARDLGTDSDPRVSVFITVPSGATAEDVAAVQQIGGGTAFVLSDGTTIAATMPLSRVAGLSQNARFGTVVVVTDTNTTDV